MNDVKQNSKEMDRESTGSSQKNRKSKRIVAFDFLRGGAIIGVLGFHVLNIVYEYSLDDAPIWFYILVLILGFFGSLYTLFILVSAVGNTFSMHSRWEKLTAGGDNAELNDKAFKHILKTQLTRGAVITFLGYFSESILNGMLLGSIVPEPWEEIRRSAVNAVFHSQILSTIGIGIMISSAIYLYLKKIGKTQKEIVKILVILTLVTLFIRPLIGQIYKLIPGYWNSAEGKMMNPRDYWFEDKSFGMFIVYFLLSPYYLGWFPLFPNLSLMFLGIIIGIEIRKEKGKISKDLLKNLLYLSFLFVVLGILYLFLADDKYMNDMLLPTAGALVVMILVLYYIEVRGKGDRLAEKTTFFRRFGNLTLTLWCLQWVMVFPLKLVNIILNAIRGTDYSFVDGPVWGGEMGGWFTWLIFFIFVGFWHVILWLWEKADFKGTLEWLSAMLMSKRKVRLKEKLYNIKSIIPEEEGEDYFSKGTKAALFLYMVVLMVLVLLPQVL